MTQHQTQYNECNALLRYMWRDTVGTLDALSRMSAQTREWLHKSLLDLAQFMQCNCAVCSQEAQHE